MYSSTSSALEDEASDADDSDATKGNGFNVSGCNPKYAAAVGTSQWSRLRSRRAMVASYFLGVDVCCMYWDQRSSKDWAVDRERRDDRAIKRKGSPEAFVRTGSFVMVMVLGIETVVVG